MASIEVEHEAVLVDVPERAVSDEERCTVVSSTCLLRRAHWVRRNLTLSLFASTDLFRRAVFYEGGGVSATRPRAQAM